MFLKSGALWKQTPISRAVLNISFGVRSKRALPQGPLHGVPRREMPRSKSPPIRSPSWGPLQRDAPFLEPFLKVPFMGSLAERWPVLTAVSQGPLHGIPRREMRRSKSPPSRSPSWGPSQRDAPFLQPSFIYLSKSPLYGHPSRIQVPLTRKGVPVERDAHFRRLS